MLFEVKKFVLKQDKALRYTFFTLHFTVQSLLGLKMTDYEKKNVTQGGGGSEKCQKIVTYYLNGP